MSSAQAARMISGEANAACTIYRFVRRDATTGRYAMVGVAQAEADGVCAETQATVGGSMPIALLDGAILKIELGGTVARDDLLASDTVGRAIDAVSGVGNYRLGRALDAGVVGDIISFQAFREFDQV